MNKKISSVLAISIIVLLAFTLGVTTWVVGNNIKVSTDLTISPRTQEPKKEECYVHVYEGDATIKVWQIKDGEKRNP